MIVELTIAEIVTPMIHLVAMDEFNQDADRDPFHIAIRDAASAHPSIVNSPKGIKSARLSQLIATSRTLASMTSRPQSDIDQDAAQMTEDAALLLGYQSERSIPVILSNHHVYKSPDIESAMAREPLMILVGLNNPSSFARLKDALVRAALIGLSAAADPNSYEPGTRKAIRKMLTVLLQMRISIDQIDDGELTEMAIDIITAISTGEGEV